MTEQTLPASRSVLDSGPISRIRRNHGLEHATLHLLGRLYPNQPLAGHSDMNGFWIIGDVSTDALQSAIAEALQRMRNGEAKLAVHPNCGTNFVTSGVLAGAAASLTMLGAGRRLRDQLDRLPMAIMLATVALILAQPLGLKIQEQVTTSGEPGTLRVVEIRIIKRGAVTTHRVITVG
jgi:Domain of unknown function (DUF6391)